MDRVALTVLAMCVLACGQPAAGEASRTTGPASLIPSPQRTDPTPPQATSPPPPVAPKPTEAPTQTLGTTADPGEAWVIVKVIDGSSSSAIAGALVRIEPYQLEARTDQAGVAEFRHLRVSGRCRWTTIVVTASGYGSLHVVDNPLYPLRGSFDFRLTDREQRSHIGAPSGSTGGESYCSR